MQFGLDGIDLVFQCDNRLMDIRIVAVGLAGDIFEDGGQVAVVMLNG